MGKTLLKLVLLMYTIISHKKFVLLPPFWRPFSPIVYLSLYHSLGQKRTSKSSKWLIKHSQAILTLYLSYVGLQTTLRYVRMTYLVLPTHSFMTYLVTNLLIIWKHLDKDVDHLSSCHTVSTPVSRHSSHKRTSKNLLPADTDTCEQWRLKPHLSFPFSLPLITSVLLPVHKLPG